MKNLGKMTSVQFAALALIITAFTIQGLGQNVTTPRPVSPASELKQRIGLTDIKVNYSRPRVTLRGNDRTGKIWGLQVPYGLTKSPRPGQEDFPWRAGANENTTISFSTDVKIEGKPLPAGKYGLHMILHDADNTTIIFSKNHTSWGSFFYKASEDALRVDVKTKTIPKTEVLTYSFIDYGTNYGVLALSWEMKQIPFKIEFDAHNIILASFRNDLRSLPGFGWQGFLTAARYCLTNNVNLEEGLQWANTAVTRNKDFNSLYVQGTLMQRTGKTAEGDKVLAEALPLGNKGQLNFVGYQLLNQKRFAKALEFFKLNASKNPEDANMWDSLGEAYKLSGDKPNAIKNLKKALTLNPLPNVKANSEKLLKELGEL